MSIMYYTHPCPIRRKREVIHKELSDLFPQLAQTWQTWGCNAYNDGMPWKPLHWRHNERNGVSNHQRLYCLLNYWPRRGSKKTSKLRVTEFCVGNSTVTGESPAQKASNAENVSIGWRHRDFLHMAFWMASFDLPNPLHWRHIGAMASRSTGNSTDCSAAPSGKQVRRQLVHITGPLGGESTSH